MSQVAYQVDVLTDEEREAAFKKPDTKAGWYACAIVAEGVQPSGTGQAMIVSKVAPCRDPENPRTADTERALQHWAIMPWIVNEADFVANAPAKIAGKQDIPVEDVTEEAIASYRKTLIRSGVTTCVEYMSAVHGYMGDAFPESVIPEVPRGQKGGTGTFVDHRGKIFTKDERDALRAEAEPAAQVLAREILGDPQKNHVGYILYAQFVEDQYNGEDVLKCAKLSCVLPAGEKLLSIA